MAGQPGLPGLPGAKVNLIDYQLLSFLFFLLLYRVNGVKLLLQQVLDHQAVQVQRVLLVNVVHLVQ